MIDALSVSREEGPAPAFRLHTLGGLEVLRDDSDEPVPLHRRQLALLALLAASPSGSLSRDRILALLWEESDETRARDSLKQAVHAIRSALREDALITELNELRLDFACVCADVVQLCASAKAGRHEEVEALYRGPFFDGFNLPKAGDFMHWVDAESARVTQLWRTSLERLATADEEAGQYALAAKRWQALATVFPLDASLARAVVLAFAGDHNVPAAVLHARLYETRLRDELGLEPDAAFRELVASVSSGSVAMESQTRDGMAVASNGGGARNEPIIRANSSLRSTPTEVNATVAAQPAESLRRSGRWPGKVGRSRLLIYGAVAVLIIAGSAYAIRLRSAAARLDPRQFYVSALTVAPEDSSLKTLGLLVREQLELGVSQFGSMRVVDLGELQSSHGTNQQAVDAQIARTAAAGTLVRGSIRRLGDSLVFSAAIVDGGTGDVRYQVEPVTVSTARQVEGAEVLRDRLVALMAVEFGDDTYSRLDASSSLPHSLEAYQLYREAEPIYFRGSFPPAFALAMRAYSLDTLFVRALIFAAHVQGEMGNCAFGDSIAFHLRSPAVVLKPLDRIVWGRDEARCRGDYRTLLSLSEEAARLRPGSAWALALVAHASLNANLPDRTIAVMKSAKHLLDSPAFVEIAGGPYLSALHAVARHNEELEFARHFEQLQPNDNEGYAYEVCALAALRRGTEIVPILTRIAQIPSGGAASAGDIARWAAGELRVHDDSVTAKMVLRWALDWYRAQPAEDQRVEAFRARFATTLADAGEIEAADSLVLALDREHPHTLEYRGMLGVLAARRGDTSAAHSEDRWLAEQPPRRGQRSMWRARIAARLGDITGALALLRGAIAEGLEPMPIILRSRIHTIDDLGPLRSTKEYAVMLRPAQ